MRLLPYSEVDKTKTYRCYLFIMPHELGLKPRALDFPFSVACSPRQAAGRGGPTAEQAQLCSSRGHQPAVLAGRRGWLFTAVFCLASTGFLRLLLAFYLVFVSWNLIAQGRVCPLVCHRPHHSSLLVLSESALAPFVALVCGSLSLLHSSSGCSRSSVPHFSFPEYNFGNGISQFSD